MDNQSLIAQLKMRDQQQGQDSKKAAFQEAVVKYRHMKIEELGQDLPWRKTELIKRRHVRKSSPTIWDT